MFNPEKLLGGLLGQGLKGAGLGTKAGAGMALLGVAMAAVEHLTSKPTSPSGPPPVGAGPSVPPPPPGGTVAPPPPPPGAPVAPPPPPPGATVAAPPSPAAGAAPAGDAVLLIRAMIASAAADGDIDPEERAKIMARLEGVGMTDDERRFIEQELASPGTVDQIAAQVGSADMAQQVYMVSLAAITVDTDVERDYLRALAQRLGLDAVARERIHRDQGVAVF